MARASSTPGEAAAEALGDPGARPDRPWLHALTGATERQIDAALRALDRFAQLEREIRDAQRAGGRDGYAQIRAPLELFVIARLLGRPEIVEVGVSSGVSSAHFLMAVARPRGGRVHSIDLPVPQRGATLGARETPVAVPPGRTSGWSVPLPLWKGWDLRIGPSQRELPKLVQTLRRIDLFLHDDLHTPAHLAWELATVRPKLRSGSVVLADNSAWTGRAFPRFAEQLGTEVFTRRGTDLLGLRVP